METKHHCFIIIAYLSIEITYGQLNIPGSKPCSQNATCSLEEACLNWFCGNPCGLYKDCGPNAECIVLDHFAKCKCLPGFVKAEYGCKPKTPAGGNACHTSDECRSTLVCVRGFCTDPCVISDCGPNTEPCTVINHSPRCVCLPGFVEDHFGCIPGEPRRCSDNSKCSFEEACIMGACANPCSIVKNCGQNAVCFVDDHTPKCICKTGFIVSVMGGCIPATISGQIRACSADAECSPPQGCIYGKCVNPCDISLCSPNTQCTVVNQKAECAPPRESRRCSDNSKCSLEEACIMGACANPCAVAEDCGRNAVCFVIDHVPKCKCIPGFVLNVMGGCGPPASPGECRTNTDCDESKACINDVCIYPCEVMTCGPNTLCFVVNHMLGCSCISSGLIPGPVGCKLPGDATKCYSQTSCSSQLSCINGYCANPCGITNCGPNAVCKVVNRKAECSCFLGFGPDNFGCKPASQPTVACHSDKGCGETLSCVKGVCFDPCRVTSCVPNAECEVFNHRAECVCLPGYEQGKYGCTPAFLSGKCSSNVDCGLASACMNGVCADPCQIVDCGPSTTCRVVNHEAACSCLPDFVPGDKGCKPKAKTGKCSSNEECELTSACVYGHCTDPCQFVNCGPDRKCVIDNHESTCILIKPQPKKCSSNEECGLTEACVYGHCTDPCHFVSCGPGMTCKVENHQGTCLVLPPEPIKCSSNKECGLTSACVYGQCADPCQFVDCGPGMTCEVDDHRAECVVLPPQPQNCSSSGECSLTSACMFGVCIDPCQFAQCDPELTCKVVNHKGECVSANPRGCSSHEQCGTSLACVDAICINPCEISKCDPDTKCIVVNHLSQCEPNSRGCSSNEQCGPSLACVDAICINPCDISECYPNSKCIVVNHFAQCEPIQKHTENKT